MRRRFAPHQLRHAHAVEMARKDVSLSVIQRQLGHANLGITSVYLQGVDNAEVIDTVQSRRVPMIPACAGLCHPEYAARPDHAQLVCARALSGERHEAPDVPIQIAGPPVLAR
jgi:integrase